MTWKVTNTSQPADPHYGAVSLLLHGDGANGSTQIIDSSVNPKTVTAVGNAQISTTESKFNGSSLKFDGTGDYLSAPDTSIFNVGTNDFTIEWWQKLATTNTSYAQFKFGSNVNGDSGARASNGVIQLFSYDPSYVINVAGNTTFTTDWEHIAISRAGGVIRLFQNGSLITPNIVNVNSSLSIVPTIIEIGKPYSVNHVDLNGYIDDFRITKGVGRYTSNFTPPTQPFQSLAV
jgi:hypothetical protein